MLTAISSVWTTLLSLFTSMFSSITEVFWDSTANELTFVGVLAVIMAGIAIILLVFNLIRSFFPMRG